MSTIIKNSHTVVPAEPTPNGRLSLSDFGLPKPFTLALILFVYKPKKFMPTEDVTETIRISLGQALVPFYPLAGRLRWIGGGRLELDCNSAGAELVVAESNSNLDEFSDFDPTPKIKHLLPKVDYGSPIDKWPVTTVLVTKFPCGGITIGVGISYAVVDGRTYFNFVKLWAKLARGETLAENEMPFLDDSLSDYRAPPLFDHVEYKPLPLLIGRSDCEEERAKETTVAMLKLTKVQIGQLKKTANRDIEKDGDHGDGFRPYSTYEVVTGHIWRCACKARRGHIGQTTVVRVIVDCRGRLEPPPPRGYAGNASLLTITDPKCVFGDLVSKPLSYAAGKIREAIENMTDEYIKSTLGFIACQEDVSWMRRGGGQFLGNPNLSVTSWINVPLYDADFGWGKPVYMGPAELLSDGKCYIIPSSDEDGSVIVALRLQAEHMGLFKKLFYEEIDNNVISKL